MRSFLTPAPFGVVAAQTAFPKLANQSNGQSAVQPLPLFRSRSTFCWDHGRPSDTLLSRTGQRVSVRAAAGSTVSHNESSGLEPASKKVGVIIVDHGSRRKESNDMLDAFVAFFRAETGRPIVEVAHMEIAEPSIATAFGRCVEQGADTVVINPYFLSPGRHWAQDIPALAAAAAKGYPGVRFLVTAPIGLHPLMVNVVEDRINHCMARVAGRAEECDVCIGTGRCQLQTAEAPVMDAGNANLQPH